MDEMAPIYASASSVAMNVFLGRRHDGKNDKGIS
jgi:hypothetical protein